MSNVIELARYRGRSQRDQQSPVGIRDEIIISLRRDTTHRWELSGAYATSPALAIQALTEVAADIATTALRHRGL